MGSVLRATSNALSLAGVNERPTDSDVVIVGGGPAGSAAAIVLARAGRQVTIIDKATFPRDKCCGDGLTTLALRELEHLDFKIDDVPSFTVVPSALLRSPRGREVEVPLPENGLYAAVATRLDFDSALLRQARAAGAHIHEACSLASATCVDGGVEIALDDGESIRAKHLIAADGMWSATRRSLGLTPNGYRGEWHAFRQYAEGVSGPAATQLIVWFEKDLLPGYAWSFPLPDGRVNIGFGVVRDGSLHGADMAQLWRDLLDRPHIANALGSNYKLVDRHTAWPIPARIDEMTLSHGSVLFVGDAAAATDVLTGEGIGQALLTGRLAAEALLSDQSAHEIARRYEHSVRDELFADHRMSQRLGKVLKSPLGAELAIRTVGRSGSWGRRNFARWMFEDEPRAIAVTPRRWHRRLFAQPGAWASTPRS